MSDQATGGGDNPSPLRCEHGLTVDGAGGEGECQLCDWCPRCDDVRRFDREVCSTCGYEWGGVVDVEALPHGLTQADVDAAELALATGQTKRIEEMREDLRVAAAPPVLAPAETPEAQDWPYYEARLSVYVRPSRPTDAFGEGGDELAHVRAWTQAPSFPDAVERLDADLGEKWTQVRAKAALVDVPPSPEVLPTPTPLWRQRVEVPVILLLLVSLALLWDLVTLAVLAR